MTAEQKALCACPDAVSLRSELTTIFGVPQVRRGETWNAAMLRLIGETLIAEREAGAAGMVEAINNGF